MDLASTNAHSGAQPRGILNLDFARFSKFAGFMFAQDFKMKTRGISGTMDFVAWEWDCSLTFKTAPPPGFFKGVTGAGQSVKLRGVSLINWAQEGGEWKIVKQDDYGKILEERENEEEDGLQRDSS